MDFSKILINWYLNNKRDLPWRGSADPYRIWLSEIMLQQTRVEQGLPYYLRFIEAFPRVLDLAEASQEKVLKLWQGLGYYSRARNLHETAKYVAFELNGIFPDNYKELKKLKGVGDYTASAIASICYNEAVPVVDGNVYRVLSRYFDIKTPINSTAGIKEFKLLAGELLDRENPSLFNQGLMEFGALQCKPRNPLCETCPFNNGCLALKKNKIGELPVKLKKLKVKKRYFNYLVFSSEDNETLLQRRKGKGIWEGLYEFPLIETRDPASPENFISEEKIEKKTGVAAGNVVLYNEKPVVHKLSHQHIHTHFWMVHSQDLGSEGIPIGKVKNYPVPVLIQNFLEESGFEDY
ncbi:A/G-specific adenine glycosylase [Salegentibacter sediminis]|uniref:A/G-specific adenine glycosylase n=1 Tax=Salegentibacter sediminis TaxID=1930251 RepID=UPI0009BD0E3C|nr:A/G-specific adenine glycosylase [Salegentibacter sediminis]